MSATAGLDPKFAKIVALMRSTEHPGEKAAAHARAESLAAAAGMTLDEAMMLDAAPKPSGFFADFDDFCERDEPGYKARRAAERLEKLRAWQVRKAAVIEKYGSEDSAIEPSERERLIIAAVEPWRSVQPKNPRWTAALDGWNTWTVANPLPPARVVDAIKAAYPLPTTFAEAKAEHEYWTARNQELEDVLSDGTPIGDTELDMPVEIRADIVRALAEHELPVTTLADLLARFAMYRDGEVAREDIEAALFRDLTAIVARGETIPASVQPAASPVHAGQIAELLREHREWSDRRIARTIGCSPTTVGKIRRDTGAECMTRSVQRRGQTYTVNIASEPGDLK